jgi:protein SCO1
MPWFVLLAVLLLSVPAVAPPAAGASLPAVLGDVALVDQAGAPFHLRDLMGRPAAITFVATRCRDTCPIVNAVFAQVARQSPRTRLVTISLDPGYDTPFVMSAYAHELQARAPGWRFVTGRPANIAAVMTAFGVVVERGDDGIPDAHSDFIYVLDGHGRLKNALPLSTRAVADLRAVLERETP